MRTCKVVGAAVLLSILTLLPSANAQTTGQVVRAVDVDLVDGGAWVTWSNGRVEARALGGGSVVQPPQPALPVFFELGESAAALVPTGDGYWLFTSAGRVVTAGAVPFHGDLRGFELNDPIVAAAPTVSGEGYYILGADGGVFTFGDAQFYGSVQGIVDEVHGAGVLAAEHLTAPIVTIATTPAGYWLIAADGAVFPFGNAPYHGSIQDALNTGNQLVGVVRTWSVTPPVAAGTQPAADALEAPIVDVVPSAEGAGYLLLASDGGIFNFGQSQFHGSLAGASSSPAIASDVAENRNGYAIINHVGHLYSFGSLLDEGAVSPSMPADRSTLEAVLTEARARRQLAIDELSSRIDAGEYGIGSDGVLRGPAGFRVDLTHDCPSDWSDTRGITSKEIRIGTTKSQSERNYVAGWQNYLDWINLNDPLVVDGTPRRVVLSNTPRNSSTVGRILYDDIFAAHVRSPAYVAANVARLNAIRSKCMPLAFVDAGLGFSHDPVNHPWVTQVSRSFLSEPILWGKYLEKEIVPKKGSLRIAAAVFDGNHASGPESLFRKWAAQRPDVIRSIETIRFDDESNLRQAMQSLAAGNPDILFVLLSGSYCDAAVREAVLTGLLEKTQLAFINSSCTMDYPELLADDGQYTDRWRTLNPDHSFADVIDRFDEPFWQLMIENLWRMGLDASDEGIRWGYYIGYPYVEALRIAAALPGGLSRSNFMLAVHSLDVWHPLNTENVPYSLLGNRDAFVGEGGTIQKWNSVTKRWEVDGVVNGNGETGTCTWIYSEPAGFCS